MDPPGGPPVKKTKRSSALETKLDLLKETLDEVVDLWIPYDPGFFMKTIDQIRIRVGQLTPSTVQQYIKNGGSNDHSVYLDELDHRLLTPSTGPQLLERTRTMRKVMSAYLGRVRQCLKGQS